MSGINKIIQELESATNVRFFRLLGICESYFGNPRIAGSHHIFTTPWPGNPRINLQKSKGGQAKPYQVRQVIQALRKLQGMSDD